LAESEFISAETFCHQQGVKEGGINSPSSFVVVYAKALEEVGMEELLDDMEQLDPEKVYFSSSRMTWLSYPATLRK
jgi:hypothetical protein